MTFWITRPNALLALLPMLCVVCLTGCDQANQLLAKTDSFTPQQDPQTQLSEFAKCAGQYLERGTLNSADIRSAARTCVAQGLPLAEQILEQPELTDDERLAAERAKLQFLMLDISLSARESRERFKAFFDELRASESPAASFGEWLVLRQSCLDEATPFVQAFAAITAYARNHPSQVESWELLVTYGEQLQERGYKTPAARCFQVVVNANLDPTNEHFAALTTRAKQQVTALRSELAKQAKAEALEARENAKYYARLGSQEDRIFVIERRIKRSGPTGYMFRTFHGRKSVLTLVKYIDMQDWSVRGTFPNNKDGVRQARARVDELKKNMIAIPGGHKGF